MLIYSVLDNVTIAGMEKECLAGLINQISEGAAPSPATNNSAVAQSGRASG